MGLLCSVSSPVEQ